MKISRIVSVLLLALPLACTPEEVPQPEKPAPAQIVIEEVDQGNLLNLGIGASVVARTGESNLEQSALHAIDGLYATPWYSPPGGRQETLTFALAAPSRIEKIGVTTVPYSPPKPVSVRFEASPDGKSWREVGVIEMQSKEGSQISAVPPFDASYIRVSTIKGAPYYSYFRSLHAIGKELRPPAPRDFGGCWMLNGLPSRIVQNGPRVSGVIESTPPTWFDGGTDGRIAKVMWMRGPTWGYAALAMSPENGTISGSTFFHMVSPYHQGPAWIGARCPTSRETASPPTDLPSRFLALAGKWSMHGLVFDERDQLLEESSRATLDALTRLLGDTSSPKLRVVAHEVRTGNRDQNRQRSAARIASLRAALQKRGIDLSRLELIAAGSERDKTYLVSTVQREMVSRLDVESP